MRAWRPAWSGSSRWRAASGFAIGGTPPFGHPAPVRTVLDPDLMAFEQVWAAAGSADSVFALSPVELREASGATVAPFREERDVAR
ncbi:MAG: YbaK/EbsC family protein [Actinomycetota bacterium]